MSIDLDRRRLLKASLAGAAAVAVGPLASAQERKAASGSAPASSGESYRFPADFLWGVATAAYQVEGAAKEDGRGPSVWDVFSHTPGKTARGDTGDVADDQYHLYKQDVQLMKQLGVKAYRFSVSWSRVFPTGEGKPNPAGLDYYRRLVDELLSNGIQPWMTLFHWDLPQGLQDKYGGWKSRDTAKAFGDYAAYVTKALSDRVSNYFTVNEISCYTDLGHSIGVFAPGLKLEPKARNQIRHFGVLAHGLGVEAIRANARQKPSVGIAENPAVCVPVIETQEHIAAARKAMGELNAPFLTAIMEGKYRDAYLAAEGENAPTFTDADMKTIGARLDFVGLNMYAPTYVRADGGKSGFAVAPMSKAYPRMDVEWLKVGPQIAYWGPRLVHELWKPPAIYITENGCCCQDEIVDGEVNDVDRVMYVRNHLIAAQRATADGVPLKGYFLWSLLDNFEWAEGYTKRFGITYVDYATQKRTPKLSAKFYAEVIRRGRVV
jgi:beta-glucosidase